MNLLNEKIDRLRGVQEAYDEELEACEEMMIPVGSADSTYEELQRLRFEVDTLQRLERIENLLGGDRLAAVEKVLESYVGCTADQLLIRSMDLIRTQPVDLDQLMLALGGKWALVVEKIRADEAERKRLLALNPQVTRSDAAPILGYRDANGNKIKPEMAAAGGE